jgi:BhlA holin family
MVGETEILKFFLTQGPFAVLFVWLLFRSEKRNEAREAEYRAEINEMKEEIKEERSVWSETLRKFTDKYDVVIDELREIKHRLK